MLDPKAKIADRQKRQENITMGNKREAEGGKKQIYGPTGRVTIYREDGNLEYLTLFARSK